MDNMKECDEYERMATMRISNYGVFFNEFETVKLVCNMHYILSNDLDFSLSISNVHMQL
jgi:hypothetical protein